MHMPQEINQEKSIIKVKELVSVEDSAELLSYRFEYDNILMWPFVRYFVLQSAINEMLSFKYPPAGLEKQSLMDILKYIFATVTKNPFRVNKDIKTDILFFSSGVVNVKEENKYVNRLYDHFAFECADKTVIIEDSCRRRYYTPRDFPKVFYHDLIPLLTFSSRLIKKTCRNDETAIENLIFYLKNNFAYKFKPDFWLDVKQILQSVSRHLPELRKQYLKLFNNIRPRIIFLEDASYGERSYIIKWAKEHKIIIAEVQHGAVMQDHPAYNYGNAIFGSDYVNYLPDFFLSNGKFWSDSVTTPSKVINIGNPYLMEQLANSRTNRNRESQYRLLIISGGTAPELLGELVLSLENILPSQDFKLIFRPHPAEALCINSRYGDILKKGIEFDLGNFYEVLPKIDGILCAEFSTVIFEAAAFGKDVFVFKNPLFSYYCTNKIFNYFETPEELYKIITSGSKIECNPQMLYDIDWRNNYHSFINNVVYAQK